MRKFLAAAFGSLFLGSAAAQAATIDVDNLLEGAMTQGGGGMGATSHVSSDTTFAFTAFQTWTVGASGRLDRIDLFGSTVQIRWLDPETWVQDQDFNVSLTILGGSQNGLPGNLELGSVTMAASELGVVARTTSFDLSGLGILASAGDVLTFRMAIDECPTVYYYCDRSWTNITYMNGVGETPELEGGAAYSLSRAGTLVYAPKDMNFRTWMSAVPEPSTWAMMIVGFGGAGAMVRSARRRHKAPSMT
jgi:PEP-CTERM putative exosortase interaction domain